jgi:peptidoglycan hydrolase-like protein with peptidoglycan-binding domain
MTARMTDDTTTTISQGATGAAVRDVQTRLESLGWDLAAEIEQGLYGPKTAQAVRAFRQQSSLAEGDSVDRSTWTALVDATFTLGDRLLYLRLPHFHGRDVRALQTALATLGFSCSPDGIFGAHTERAVREFQQNAGINGDGIVGDSTFSAIKRLQYAWEGKDPLMLEARQLGFARAAEVLESTPLCIYGADEIGRNIAERISNLAMATTSASLVVSVHSPKQAPDDLALMLQLVSDAAGGAAAAGVAGALNPQVIYDNDETLKTRMATAIKLVTDEQRRANKRGGERRRNPRITVLLPSRSKDGTPLSPREEQHAAIALLDALCLSL